jgi:hypothetical protein
VSGTTVGAVLAQRRPRHPVGWLLTPSGSLPSPRWRWWARVVAAGPVLFLVSALSPGSLEPPYQSVSNPLAIPALATPLSAVRGLGGVVTGLAVPIAAAALVLGFRRARGVERQQVDLDALRAELLAVVDQTMQPTRVSLWLRPEP